VIPIDAGLKALAGIISLSFACIALGAARGSPRNAWLGVFLLLIAGNQGAEVLRALATSAHDQDLWFRVASVFASLDPVALALFASHAFPRRTPTWVLASVLAVGGADAVYAGWAAHYSASVNPTSVFDFVRALETLLVYGWVLLGAMEMLRTEPGAPTWGDLVPAMGVATLPTAVSLVIAGFTLIFPFYPADVRDGTHPLPYLGPRLALGVVVMALLVAWLSRAALREAPGPTRRRLVAATLSSAAVLVLLQLPGLLSQVAIPATPGPDAIVTVLGRSGAAIRWLIFGAFASAMVLRDKATPLGQAARRRAARAFLAIAFISLAVMAMSAVLLATGSTASTLAMGALVVAAALAISQGFRTLVDGIATRLYGFPQPAAPPPPGDVLPGAIVAGRYHVLRELGRGNTGRAFLARDEGLRREVALKVLAEGDTRGLREARIAGSVSHPHVVAVFDILAVGSATVIVSQFVPGGSLGDRLAARGPFELREGLRTLDQVAQGVAALHAAGVVHRDLAPGNVLLGPDGVPRITDFSIAGRFARGTVALDASILRRGTPGFVAPEQARGETPTPRADVYALGALARAAVRAPLPPAVEAVVVKALDEDPARRQPDAAAWLAELRAAVASLPEDQRAAPDAHDGAVPEDAALPGSELPQV
jgi:hypothetical protein